MRYIEYVYLVLAGMSFTFMVTEYERLNGQRITFVLLALGIFAFMYTFRRSQRIRFEKMEAEQIEELEEEMAEWAEEEEEKRRQEAADTENQDSAS